MADTLPEPSYPTDTRSKGWRFEIDHERIMQSDTWALSPAPLRPWLLMLWMIAWQQNPCGSLPDSDELIAARLGMPLSDFVAQRNILMRGWVKHSDGRLYHAVVSERVIEMLKARERESQRKAGYRSKLKSQTDVPDLSHGTTTGLPQDSTRSHGTSTGTSTSNEEPFSNEKGSAQQKADRLPDCPHQEIIALYAKHLPELPQPRIWDGQRAKSLQARWRWVLTACKQDGQRYATTSDEAIDFFDRYFQYVARVDFLTGRDGRWQSCDLGWLVKAENFAKVIEGKYVRREDA